VPRLGAHLSAAGGAWRAVESARSCGCEALQLFQRAPGRWAAAAFVEEDAVRFRGAARTAGLDGLCFAHAPYLLNLASDDRTLRERSIAVLVEELQRGGRLGLAGVVLHPGSGGKGDRASAEARCRAAVSEAVDRAGNGAATLLLEGQAGSGGQLGRTPTELAQLVDPELRSAAQGGRRPRVGVCLDSAHLWGAGYDLLGDGWERVLGELADSWQLEAPQLFHGNDTAVELGSHRDRHAPPGDGKLGRKFFSKLLHDRRCTDMPVVLEIPPGEDNALVKKALARLRRWAR
jgi:deoxyribonuclease-4